MLSNYQIIKDDSLPRSCVQQTNVRVLYPFVTSSVFDDNLFGSLLSRFFKKGRVMSPAVIQLASPAVIQLASHHGGSRSIPSEVR
jgi:hypothetical protein